MLIFRRLKLYFTASGMSLSVSGRTVYRLRADCSPLSILNVDIKDVCYFTLMQDMCYDTEQPLKAMELLYMPPELALNVKFGKYPVVVWILKL
jgi:hypothetical protein